MDKEASVSPEIKVSLSLSPDSQIADGKSAIKAKATVTQGGFALPGAKLKFELEGNAQFTDSNAQTTADVTGADGRVTKNFTDTVPEEGYVSAVLDADMEAFAEAPYTFTGVPLHFGDPIVDDSNGFADGVSLMTLRVQLLQGDKGVANEHVRLSLVDTAAQFVDENGSQIGKIYVALTDADGYVSAIFTTTMVELGYIFISVEDMSAPRTRAQFRSRPVPKIVLAVKPHGARADGKSPITATATVRAAQTDEAMPDVKVVFTLPNWVALADGTPLPSDGLVHGVTDSSGNAHVSFTSTTIDKGTVQVVAAANPASYHDTADFIFGGKWAGVSDISLHFVGAGNIRAASIFKNGLHQAELRLRLVLKDWNDHLVQDSDAPTIDEVMAAVSLIDFDHSADALGVAPLQNIQVTTNANEFEKHITTHTERVGAGKDGGTDGGGNYISGGAAYFTLYVTCEEAEQLMSINIGVEVRQPNEVVVYNAIDGTYKEKMAALVFLPLANYRYSVADLNFSGAHHAHEGEKDDAPYSEKGDKEHPGNFWRMWEYAIDFSQDTQAKPYAPSLYKVCLAEGAGLAGDYVFAERVDVVYSYRAYFWPMNLYDHNRLPVAEHGKRDYQVGAPAQRDQAVTYPEGTAGCRVMYYASFGDINGRTNAKIYRPINLVIFDQYGNKGKIHLDPLSLPPIYSSETLQKWQYAGDGFIQNGDTTSPAKPPMDVTMKVAFKEEKEENELEFRSLTVDDNKKLDAYMGGPVLSLNKREVRWQIQSKNNETYADQRAYILNYEDFFVRHTQADSETDNGPFILSRKSDDLGWYFKPLWKFGTTVLARDNEPKGAYMCWKFGDFGLSGGEQYPAWCIFTLPYVPNDSIYEWTLVV
ncbi:MAG: Ig-like domain-containing protein [Achromobacter sp.]|uniref:Ig-like domain-containing protein n=1 Tax=Achromobacter sp. TaxID=134375 RepID=UPI003D05BFE2